MNYTYFTQYNIRLSSTKQNLQKDRMSKYVTGNSFFLSVNFTKVAFCSKGGFQGYAKVTQFIFISQNLAALSVAVIFESRE